MRVLKPRLSVYINGFLTFLWVVGFALLTWNLSGLLSNRCDIEHWDHETGVMICRLYKALETFSITGMYVTISLTHISYKYQEKLILSQALYGRRFRP